LFRLRGVGIGVGVGDPNVGPILHFMVYFKHF
jgi:hypothetical protein